MSWRDAVEAVAAVFGDLFYWTGLAWWVSVVIVVAMVALGWCLDRRFRRKCARIRQRSVERLIEYEIQCSATALRERQRSKR